MVVLQLFSDAMLPLWASCSLSHPPLLLFPCFQIWEGTIILVACTPGISCRECVNWSEKNTNLTLSSGYGQVTDCLMRTQVKVKKGDHGEPGLLPALAHHLVNRQVRIMERELGSSVQINLGGRVAANLWTLPAQTIHQTPNLFTRPGG